MVELINKKIIIELHYRKICNYQGEIVEFYFNDVTSILSKVEREKEQNKIRSLILAKISHEFKTPLITIIYILKDYIEKRKKLYNQLENESSERKDSTKYMLEYINIPSNREYKINLINKNIISEENRKNDEDNSINRLSSIRRLNTSNLLNYSNFPKFGTLNKEFKYEKNKTSCLSDSIIIDEDNFENNNRIIDNSINFKDKDKILSNDKKKK